MRSVRFAKGHGTGNDFVLLHDPDGDLTMTPQAVRDLCDRRRGVGGDAAIRVVRTRNVPAAQRGMTPDSAQPTGFEQAEWMMDYWNCDGSLAEMCGNGIRVLAAYLLQTGLASVAVGAPIPIATRSGLKYVTWQSDSDGDRYEVRMGPWDVIGGEAAVAAASDVEVRVAGCSVPLPGLSVRTGNPHVVTALPANLELTDLDLSQPPSIDPAPADGANVEFLVPHPAPAGTGHVGMRVHERGVGETLSCGTAVTATAIAARAWGGKDAPRHWIVDVRGGRLTVDLPELDDAATSLANGQDAVLAGPAVIVAQGTLSQELAAGY